jgi:hypothetical protein
VVEVVLVLCRNRKAFVEWCDDNDYELATDHSAVGTKGDESIAVRGVKMADIEGLAVDRIEFLDCFSTRPDAELATRYALHHLRTPAER